MSWSLRILRHADVDPRTLKPHPLNMRMHPPQQQVALDTLLGEIGWVRDVIVNEVTGYIVDGHLRVERAIFDGQSTVPVAYVNMTEAEEKLALALLDHITSLAYSDQEMLRTLLSSIAPDKQRVIELLNVLRQQTGIELPTAQVDPLKATDDGTLADVQAIIGGFSFIVQRAVFLKWRESLYQTIGLKTPEIVAEIRKRLEL